MVRFVGDISDFLFTYLQMQVIAKNSIIERMNQDKPRLCITKQIDLPDVINIEVHYQTENQDIRSCNVASIVIQRNKDEIALQVGCSCEALKYELRGYRSVLRDAVKHVITY